MTTIDTTVCNVLATLCKREHVELQDELIHDLNVDSMAFVALVVELEARTGARFADEDLILEMYPTAGHLAEYISRRKTSMEAVS